MSRQVVNKGATQINFAVDNSAVATALGRLTAELHE